VGKNLGEGRDDIFPDLLPASHFCLAADQRRSIAAHHCPDAGTLINADSPQICPVMDQNRLDAMKKLEELKKSATEVKEAAESQADQIQQEMRQ
jgi:hypothetical protein